MEIEIVSRVTDEIFEAVLLLVPQIGLHKPKPSRKELETLVASEGSRLLVVRYPDRSSGIVGMLSLSIYRVPTGIRAIMEDVVVDENHRGKGIAKALIVKGLDLARQAGAAGVALTSNPQRVAANQLYISLGFQNRKTNAYYFNLT